MAAGRYKPNVDYTHFTRSCSTRHSAPLQMIVVHTTQGSNIKGIADLKSLGNWWDTSFGTPQASSSTVGVDAEGNSARYVRDRDKPWTQAFYNPWSLSIENIGFAEQADWTDLQVKENARWIAYWSHLHDIPCRKGHVTLDGRITLPGVFRHKDLGNLGGGHNDPGTFPLAECLHLARQYRKEYNR